MSISPVSSGSAWSLATAARNGTSAVTAGDFAAAMVTPHRFLPNDPANGYLTDGDRTALRSATGVDVRANGDILSPVSMNVSTYCSALDAAGQIAADRASGNLTGSITQDYLSKVLKAVAAQQPSGQFRGDSGLDVSA
jgi:hypothetical protein